MTNRTRINLPSPRTDNVQRCARLQQVGLSAVVQAHAYVQVQRNSFDQLVAALIRQAHFGDKLACSTRTFIRKTAATGVLAKMRARQSQVMQNASRKKTALRQI